MDPDSTNQIAAMLLFLVMSGFFSFSERVLAIGGHKLKTMAGFIGRVSGKPEKLLTILRYGRILCASVLGVLAHGLALRCAEDSVFMLTAALITILIALVVFVEMPAASLARKVFGKLPGATVTENEIMTMLDMSHKEGVLEDDERDMIENVFEFGDIFAKDIMTPRTDIVSVENSASYTEIMELFRSERYSRILVYTEDIDDIIGMLIFKDFVFSGKDDQSFNIDEMLRPVFFSYETKPISKLFKEMRQAGIPMAVILDEYSGTSGIVTIEDLVEVVVGDISDEDDEDDEDYTKVSESEFLVDGSMRIDDFNDMADTDFQSDDYESIGGYLLGVLGRIPESGDSYSEAGVSFVIEDMEKNRIDKLRITISREESALPNENKAQ